MLASVVCALDRVGLVNEPLHGRHRRVVFQADERSALARCRLLDADLRVGDTDLRAASRAVDLRFDSVEVERHPETIARVAESGEAA